MFAEAAKSISPVPVRMMLPGSRVRFPPLPATTDRGSGLDASAPATNRNEDEGL